MSRLYTCGLFLATTRFTHSTFSRARPPETSEVILLSQQPRFEPAHLTGAGGILVRAFPANDRSHKGSRGRRSASLVSPYPAKRQYMDYLLKGKRDYLEADVINCAALFETIVVTSETTLLFVR